MSGTRIYEVKTRQMATIGGTQVKVESFLVEAKSREGAEKHVAAKFVESSEIAAPKRIAELMGSGAKVESAGEVA